MLTQVLWTLFFWDGNCLVLGELGHNQGNRGFGQVSKKIERILKDLYLEDHPRTCKWLVTPIYKPWMAIYKGNNPILRILINHAY